MSEEYLRLETLKRVLKDANNLTGTITYSNTLFSIYAERWNRFIKEKQTTTPENNPNIEITPNNKYNQCTRIITDINHLLDLIDPPTYVADTGVKQKYLTALKNLQRFVQGLHNPTLQQTQDKRTAYKTGFNQIPTSITGLDILNYINTSECRNLLTNNINSAFTDFNTTIHYNEYWKYAGNVMGLVFRLITGLTYCDDLYFSAMNPQDPDKPVTGYLIDKLDLLHYMSLYDFQIWNNYGVPCGNLNLIQDSLTVTEYNEAKNSVDSKNYLELTLPITKKTNLELLQVGNWIVKKENLNGEGMRYLITEVEKTDQKIKVIAADLSVATLLTVQNTRSDAVIGSTDPKILFKDIILITGNPPTIPSSDVGTSPIYNLKKYLDYCTLAGYDYVFEFTGDTESLNINKKETRQNIIFLSEASITEKKTEQKIEDMIQSTRNVYESRRLERDEHVYTLSRDATYNVGNIIAAGQGAWCSKPDGGFENCPTPINSLVWKQNSYHLGEDEIHYKTLTNNLGDRLVFNTDEYNTSTNPDLSTTEKSDDYFYKTIQKNRRTNYDNFIKTKSTIKEFKLDLTLNMMEYYALKQKQDVNIGDIIILERADESYQIAEVVSTVKSYNNLLDSEIVLGSLLKNFTDSGEYVQAPLLNTTLTNILQYIGVEI